MEIGYVDFLRHVPVCLECNAVIVIVNFGYAEQLVVTVPVILSKQRKVSDRVWDYD